MDRTVFLTIFPTYEKLAVVKRTLPAVVEETRRNDARLIVHDSSTQGRQEKWDYLLDLNRGQDFFLLLSDNLSMAHARNLCLHLGQAMYAPDYICLLEDDHGFRPGLIPALVEAMQQYYGKVSPNGLRYGLFTGCGTHHTPKRHVLADGHAYPDSSNKPEHIGRANSCFRCAPTAHWNNVLRGYDTDEYLISTFQTGQMNLRNYHKGYTTLFVKNGLLAFDVEHPGRGCTINKSNLRLWDDTYTASDARSRYIGKPGVDSRG